MPQTRRKIGTTDFSYGVTSATGVLHPKRRGTRYPAARRAALLILYHAPAPFARNSWENPGGAALGLYFPVWAWWGKISSICMIMSYFLSPPAIGEGMCRASRRGAQYAPARFLERKLGKELPAKLRFASAPARGVGAETDLRARPVGCALRRRGGCPHPPAGLAYRPFVGAACGRPPCRAGACPRRARFLSNP